jgi:hypothetical protein
MAGIIERLTEGIVNRDMRAEGHALLEKWERTGFWKVLIAIASVNLWLVCLKIKQKSFSVKLLPWPVVMSKVLQPSHSPSSVVFSRD